jgi:phosphopantothenoylcysteine decarboxylase/phosphopantothenate--cysteine ligase
MTIFQGKHIVLGVTGSIAAYKAADLASKLTQAGVVVDVVLTEAAARFVTPLTFQSVTGRPAHTDLWAASAEAHIAHVALGQQAHLIVIAPATAGTIAKLAHGLADNLLTVTALAARCPLLLAPAMDGGMYEHPATQANLKTLAERGVILLGPGQGRMASGLVGHGRLLEPDEIMGQIRLALARGGSLTGRHVVVTAGGTQEPIDPVRFISNRSSGKQGFAWRAPRPWRRRPAPGLFTFKPRRPWPRPCWRPVPRPMCCSWQRRWLTSARRRWPSTS